MVLLSFRRRFENEFRQDESLTREMTEKCWRGCRVDVLSTTACSINARRSKRVGVFENDRFTNKLSTILIRFFFFLNRCDLQSVGITTIRARSDDSFWFRSFHWRSWVLTNLTSRRVSTVKPEIMMSCNTKKQRFYV